MEPTNRYRVTMYVGKTPTDVSHWETERGATTYMNTLFRLHPIYTDAGLVDTFSGKLVFFKQPHKEST